MDMNITHKDIGPDLCRRCAACCRIYLNLPGTDTRYRKFLRRLGYILDHPVPPGREDCCDKKHDIRLDMGDCRHLERCEEHGEQLFHCRIYGTPEYPQLCAEFDCVSWARCRGHYHEKNNTLATAQRVLDATRGNAASQKVNSPPICVADMP